jgi:hypothetical protein
MLTKLQTFVDRQLPLLKTLRGQTREDLKGDLTAGLTTAVTAAPRLNSLKPAALTSSEA